MLSFWLRKTYRHILLAIKGTETDFSSSSIRRAIFLLAVPMILEMVMESLFAVVDVFFVGRIGTYAVATVGLTESVITLIYAVAIGVSMAVTALVARRVGEKRLKEASDAAFQAIFLAVLAGVGVGIAGFIYAADILRLMGGDRVLVEAGAGYTRILFAGNLSIMLLFLINGVFRGAGNASLAMRALWLANGLNILLDPLLIFGFGPVPALGLEGAAIATTIGRSVGVLYQCYHLIGGESLVKLGRKNLMLQWRTLRRLIDLSVGGMGQFLVESASWIFLVRIIALFGSEVLAGYTIAIRIIIFSILPSWGLSNAAATLVGQSLGAGRPARAEKSVWRTAYYNLLFLVVLSVVFIAGAPQFVGLFSSEPAVVKAGVQSLRIICLGYIFLAYGMVVAQSFNGAGDTRTPLYINLVAYWLLQIPLAWLLAVPLKLEANGVYIAIAFSFSVAAVISVVVFRRGRWKQVRV